MDISSHADEPAYVTNVSEMKGDFATLFGYSVDDLAASCSFTEAVYLAMAGELPTVNQRTMLDSLLVLTVAHGVAPSGALARSFISCGSPIQVALAGSALSIGDVHGGAGEQVGRTFQEGGISLAEREGLRSAAETLVTEGLKGGGRVAGFGHAWHKEGDPRARVLLQEAARCEIAGTACQLLEAMEDVLAERRGRRIIANIDGVVAAILTDMGIDWRFTRPIMILSRTMTLAALAVEELKSRSQDWHDLILPNERYIGPPRRAVAGRTS